MNEQSFLYEQDLVVYDVCMACLQLVGSLKLKISFAKEPYRRVYILQKRPIILRSLSKATAYNQTDRSHHPTCFFLKEVHLVCIPSFTSCEQQVLSLFRVLSFALSLSLFLSLSLSLSLSLAHLQHPLLCAHKTHPSYMHDRYASTQNTYIND